MRGTERPARFRGLGRDGIMRRSAERNPRAAVPNPFPSRRHERRALVPDQDLATAGRRRRRRVHRAGDRDRDARLAGLGRCQALGQCRRKRDPRAHPAGGYRRIRQGHGTPRGALRRAGLCAGMQGLPRGRRRRRTQVRRQGRVGEGDCAGRQAHVRARDQGHPRDAGEGRQPRPHRRRGAGGGRAHGQCQRRELEGPCCGGRARRARRDGGGGRRRAHGRAGRSGSMRQVPPDRRRRRAEGRRPHRLDPAREARPRLPCTSPHCAATRACPRAAAWPS